MVAGRRRDTPGPYRAIPTHQCGSDGLPGRTSPEPATGTSCAARATDTVSAADSCGTAEEPSGPPAPPAIPPAPPLPPFAPLPPLPPAPPAPPAPPIPSAPLTPAAPLRNPPDHPHRRSSSAQVISATLPRKRVVPPPHRYALHRRRRRSSAPLSPASGWCPHLIATLCIVVGAGHQRHSPPQAGGAPTSSLRSASSSAQVI